MERGRDPHIHKYLWRDVGESAFAGWKLTLSDTEATAFLAFTALLLVYAQTRAWVLVRAAVRRFTRPIQLPDDNEAYALTRLTQKEALSCLIRDIVHPRGTQPRHMGNRTMTTVSPLYGISSILTVAAFLSCEVIIPWALTGSLETPVVQSQRWDRCFHRQGNATVSWGTVSWATDSDGEIADRAADKYQRCWFNTSTILPTCSREKGILFDRPTVYIATTNISCPFSPKACHPDSSPLQLDYINISLRDVGLNIGSDLRFSRRTTCSPLNINHFLRNTSDGTTWLHFGTENLSLFDRDAAPPRLRVRLTNPDGRNTPPSSGPWLDERTPDLRYWTANENVAHPDLVRSDGELIVLLYGVGRAVYRRPINDPMYSAHNRLQDRGGQCWPDYEYTAMACHEQHRICLSNGPCTSYSSAWKLFWDCFGYHRPRLSGPRLSKPFWDIIASSSHLKFQTCSLLLPERGALGSIFRFVSARGVAAMLSFERYTWPYSYIPVDPEGQWILDVKAWFESSFLMVRQGLLLPRMGNPTPLFKTEESREMRCGRVLMLHGDYTNINFAGFLLTLGVVVGISGFSHGKRVSRLWGWVRRVGFGAWCRQRWITLVSLREVIGSRGRLREGEGEGEVRRQGGCLDENFELP